MKHWGAVLLGILALGLVGLMGYMMWRGEGERKLSGIDVDIEELSESPLFMDTTDVMNELRARGLDYTGAPIDSIDLAFVEASLRENPIFAQAEVYIAPSSARMKVKVRQEAAFFVVHSGGEHYYVTRQRGVLPINPKYAIYVPVVTGTMSQEYATHELFDLMTAIEQSEHYRDYFGHCYVDPKAGIILTPRIGRTSVILGHSGDWAGMLAKLRIFEQEIIPRKGWDAIEYVKLAYARQIVVRERQP